MHAELESATDIASHVLYDPSIGGRVEKEAEVEAAARAGTLLAMYTAGDGALGYRIYVDEDLPDALRGRVATTHEGLLLKVPSGKLVASGLEHHGDATKAAATAEVPAGNYLVDAYELDYDWDRDIVPVLRAELGSAYGRDTMIRAVSGLLILAGVGCLVAGALAWSVFVAVGGAVALVLGLGLARLATTAAYEARRREIELRFPGLVLVLRRLDAAADLSAHAGKPLSFTD